MTNRSTRFPILKSGTLILSVLISQVAWTSEVPNISKRPTIDEIRKSMEPPRSTESPKVGEVVRSSDGKLAPFLAVKQVCPKPRECHQLVTDTRTQVLTAFDDKWMPGIKETGEGQKLVREHLPPTRAAAPSK